MSITVIAGGGFTVVSAFDEARGILTPRRSSAGLNYRRSRFLMI
jgi:hypothetical protein